MSIILKQRNFLLTQIFEITDNSLNVKIAKPLNYYETDLKYEELGNKISRLKKPNISMLIGFSVSLFMTVVFYFSWRDNSKETPIIWFIALALMTSLFALGFFIFSENKVNISFNNIIYLSFYANSPDKKEVDFFIAELQKTQKQYLLNRYAKKDLYLSPEQVFNNLNWLRDRNIIDDLELEQMREKLLVKTNSNSAMGFKLNSDNN